MSCSYHISFYFPEQFATEPRTRPSKRRDRELKAVKRRGQQRRILISTYGEVYAPDMPLYEALLLARYPAIAVIVVVGCAEPADIRAAKAFSRKNPLPWISNGRMPPGVEYVLAIRDVHQAYLERAQSTGGGDA
jgi:hypothetical protein